MNSINNLLVSREVPELTQRLRLINLLGALLFVDGKHVLSFEGGQWRLVGQIESLHQTPLVDFVIDSRGNSEDRGAHYIFLDLLAADLIDPAFEDLGLLDLLSIRTNRTLDATIIRRFDSNKLDYILGATSLLWGPLLLLRGYNILDDGNCSLLDLEDLIVDLVDLLAGLEASHDGHLEVQHY